MGFKILAINPGSTSTKIALYNDELSIMELTLRHTTEQILQFARTADQLEWRRELILKALREHNCDIRQLSTVIGRGGLTKPIRSGVYLVNQAMRHDLIHATMEHACNLGALIADDIAHIAGIKAYVADPVVVDELDDVARLSGIPECPRLSVFHALNQKATARLYCKEHLCRYEDSNLIVAHLGGGISICAHRKGLAVDTNDALYGEGPIAPERAGTVPAGQLVDLCFSGKYTRDQIRNRLSGKGGMVSHLGINSMILAMERVEQGDPKATAFFEAMCYTIGKQIGAMAAALKGQVDAIVLTGGLAFNDTIIQKVSDYCRFIAPISVYPGENEMKSLIYNALTVLRGEVEPKIYK